MQMKFVEIAPIVNSENYTKSHYVWYAYLRKYIMFCISDGMLFDL